MNNFLTEQRAKLDEIDFELLSLMSRRFDVVSEIGEYKKANNIPIVQQHRMNEVLERCTQQGAVYGLSEEFVRKLFSLIMDEACRLEE